MKKYKGKLYKDLFISTSGKTEVICNGDGDHYWTTERSRIHHQQHCILFRPKSIRKGHSFQDIPLNISIQVGNVI